MSIKFLLLALIFVLGQIVTSLPLKHTEQTNQCHNLESCLKEKIKQSGPTPKQLCDLCYLGMPVARELIAKNDTKYFKDIAVFVCTVLNITTIEVCSSAIDLFEWPVLNIINDTTLNDQELCSAGIGCGPIKNPILNWDIAFPNVPKPPVNPPKPPSPSAPKIRILQISDLHIDFEYQPGSLADCDQPLCCRNSSTSSNKKITSDRQAGYWGDYRNCDIPLWTVENMFDHISKNEQFDYVYWTGDLPPHNVWNQSRGDQLNALDVLTDLFKKYFPNKAIYPTLGNHESTPVNFYPTPYNKEDSISWLYDKIAKDWTQTGLPSFLAPNISLGGFYSLSIAPGLRVVSLNMNYCPSGNFYLYVNSTDPLGQLGWLVKTLQDSENNGEKVHIIGHIHPDGCLDSFSSNYYKIINRYESTIVGQFFGHSHSDQFTIFYDLNNLTRAVGVSYISGSVTTYSYLNPNYRIYTIDGSYNGSSYQVLDHENNYLNLTEANLNSNPIWRKEYSAKDAFNLPSLYPQDWDNLLNEMLNNLNGPLVDKLYRYHSKLSDAQGPCDESCRKNFVCGFKQARSDNFIQC